NWYSSIVCCPFGGEAPGRRSCGPAIKSLGRRLALCARRLVDCSAQSLGKLDRVVIGPEVQEEQPRLLVEHGLWTAGTSMPFERSALITGLTSSPVSTKSPVMAALPPPVGWKPIAVATPVGPGGASCVPLSFTGSRRGTPN